MQGGRLSRVPIRSREVDTDLRRGTGKVVSGVQCWLITGDCGSFEGQDAGTAGGRTLALQFVTAESFYKVELLEIRMIALDSRHSFLFCCII